MSNPLVSGMLLVAALGHFYDPMPIVWRGWGMGHRSVGRALGTSNIVPGMPRDHPTSIPAAGGPQSDSNRAHGSQYFLVGQSVVFDDIVMFFFKVYRMYTNFDIRPGAPLWGPWTLP